MSRAREIARIGYRQIRNIVRFAQQEPLYRPAFSSMTLDGDDIGLAQTFLEDRGTWFQEKLVSEYEESFAHWNGSKYAYAFAAGRVALSAIIYALNLQPGDEVILPGYTCVVVPNAFNYVGIHPIYSDIELDTYGLDAQLLLTKITPHTKAIMLHHLYGLVCRDYEEIVHIARQRGIWLIEDCAHSTGAEYNGRKVGTLGDVAFYSSEQSKVYTTIQGGIAVTDNDSLAHRLEEFQHQSPFPSSEKIEKLLKSVILNYYLYKHPQRWWRGDVATLSFGDVALTSTTLDEELGIRPADYGQRMAVPLAAIGLNQLAKLDQYNDLRRKNATRWYKWCHTNGYTPPLIIDNSKPIFLRYPVLVEPEKKMERNWAVHELGVELGTWFTSHIHPAKRTIGNCKNATTAVRRCINLPTLYSEVVNK